MKTNIGPLKPDTFYHIYNRGINKENIFKEDRNYWFFLKKYYRYIAPVASTYAYCLLKNHFHFLILTHSERDLKALYPPKKAYEPEKTLSLRFSHLFNSYAQTINKACSRTGALFERPYRRIEVSDDSYLIQLIYYIHFNPQKHCLVRDFRTYPHSSYIRYVRGTDKQLKRTEMMELFGGKENFLNEHTYNADKSIMLAEFEH